MTVDLYHDNFNPDLLKLIPPDAKIILEIGCGNGRLAEAYRRVNPGVKWQGIEPDEYACREARDRMDVAIPITAEVFAASPACSDRHLADCLILGDVLEHLEQPWDVLRALRHHLAPGAQALASIPNIGHWTVIRDLLNGKWTYTDEGLLDRTHLRFFTLDSIRELFEGAGLQVFEIRGREIGNEGHGRFLEYLDKCPLPGDFARQSRAFQYLVRAVKPKIIGMQEFSEPGVIYEPIRKLHIHAVLGEACCARPRILEPFAALETVPGVRCTTGDSWQKPDVLIQQRFRSIRDMDLQRRFARDSLVIAELDDDPESPIYTHGQPFDPMPLKAVHAVQVSTERLAEIVRQWNPNVMVFENQIAELPPWSDIEATHRPSFRPDEGPVIFYGAQNREADWESIMPALNRVLADHPGVAVDVIHDRAFFGAIKTKNKTFAPFCSYAEYRARLRMTDIALLPLEPGRFNECKSDIKFLECAAEGVACVMSDTVYGHVWCQYPEGPLAACYKWPASFEDCLRSLTEKPELRRKCAERSYAYVRDHRLLGQHFRKRLAWYQSLLASREVLDQSLRERVPELFRSADHSPRLSPQEISA